MCRSYASLLHFQEGWSSLQRHSRAPGNLYPGLTPQTGRLGNLQARIPQKMCSKNIQSTSDCGSWVSPLADGGKEVEFDCGAKHLGALISRQRFENAFRGRLS